MTLQFRPLFFSLSLFTIALCSHDDAQAFFTDVKGMEMGAAVTAHPLDSISGAYNPAGLAFVGDRWDLGVHWAKKWGHANFHDNALVNGRFNMFKSQDNFFMGEFGINKRTCCCEYTWGFILYNRSFFKSTYKHTNPIFGTSHPGIEYMHYVAAPTGTLTIGCNHALGVTIDFHGQRLKVRGLENFKH